jgi:hypothetical protein
MSLRARAQRHSPADPEVAAYWDLVVKGIDVGWLDPDEIRELVEHLRDHRDFGSKSCYLLTPVASYASRS